jgi:type II secretory ATPase GspE/PulE/Tfp pilus assembly ATPase PilB-like protein
MLMPAIDHTAEATEIVRSVLDRAVAENATDVYWIPLANGVKVRFRVSGVQHDVVALSGPVGEQCVTHVKVLGGLLTYRTSTAQDGVIRWDDGMTEMRVASMPTHFGERLTIRLLSVDQTPEHLEDLGFLPDVEDGIRQALTRQDGMVILTGPTGSGKSTTIYALIRELIRNDRDPSSIITLEDPIERVIGGISQVSVKSNDESWNYELALKAALRQDVKTLVIGELRDPHIAKVALDAALTGHRVITTYHAGDVAGVYTRLLHHGFEPFLIASAITCVMTQRLIAGTDNQVVPIGAILRPDDEWRDMICGNPSIPMLRDGLKARPLADIRQQAERLLKSNVISKRQAALVGTP